MDHGLTAAVEMHTGMGDMLSEDARQHDQEEPPLILRAHDTDIEVTIRAVGLRADHIATIEGMYMRRDEQDVVELVALIAIEDHIAMTRTRMDQLPHEDMEIARPPSLEERLFRVARTVIPLGIQRWKERRIEADPGAHREAAIHGRTVQHTIIEQQLIRRIPETLQLRAQCIALPIAARDVVIRFRRNIGDGHTVTVHVQSVHDLV